ADVSVEPGDRQAGGSPRVRINLSQPVGYHVRADRNSVVVDFDKAPAKAAPAAATVVPAIARPATTSQPAPRTGDQLQQLVMSTRGAVDPIAALGLNAAPAGQVQTPTGLPREPAPQPSNQRRFSGNPVSLDFQGADLRAVLRTFSEISSLNIVIDPT